MFGKQRTYGNRGFGDRRPPSNETVISSERIQIERKSFQFTLKENPRGKVLRITEDVGGRRDSIIVPATGLDEFCKVLGDVAKGADNVSPPVDPENPLDA
jgi:hypothetical protein